MTRRATLLTMVGMVFAITAWSEPTTTRRVRTTTQCRGPDALSAQLISYLQVLVTGTDTATITRRQAWGLPATSASNVTLVTDSRTCAKAADAYSADEDTLSPMVGRQAYVVKVATLYVVWDPTVHVGEWSPYRIMDNKFKVTGTISG